MVENKPTIYDAPTVYNLGGNGGGGGDLPEGYLELIYIFANGINSTINFPAGIFEIAKDDTIILKFSNCRINSNTYNFRAIDCYNSSLNKMIYFAIDEISGNNRYSGQWGTSYTGISTTGVNAYTYVDYICEMKSNENISINGTLYNWNREPISATMRSINVREGNFSKYYRIQIKNNGGQIKFDFVPCKRILDNIAGFYEKTTKTFISSGWAAGLPK